MKRLTANQVKLGFIGLGNMGSRIAKRLLDHAYRVSVYDVDRTKVEAVASYGGVVANNILELVRGTDVLLFASREIDGAAIEPARRARLEAGELDAARRQTAGERLG